MRARAVSWALAGLLLGGCAGRSPPKTPAVVVTALELSFPERDRGLLAFSLRTPAGRPRPRELSWELFLDGARFAAGLEGGPTPLDGAYQVRASLAVRHVGWRDGEATVDVVLQGEVDFGDGGERVRFRDRRDAVVQGRPQLSVPRD